MSPVLHWPSLAVATAKATREATTKIRVNIVKSKAGWLRGDRSMTVNAIQRAVKQWEKVVFKAHVLYDSEESSAWICLGILLHFLTPRLSLKLQKVRRRNAYEHVPWFLAYNAWVD
jgi:hypothetical protein